MISPKHLLVFLLLNLLGPAGIAGAVEPFEAVELRRGDLILRGRVLGYDGRYLRLATDQGEVTVDYRAMECLGMECPNPDDYIQRVKLSGSARLAGFLIPALIEGYGRENGYSVETQKTDIRHDLYRLIDPESGDIIAQFEFHTVTAAEGFADIITHTADIALSEREASSAEIARATAAGIGDISSAGRAKIIALDALLPISSARQSQISLGVDQLLALFSGQVKDWSNLGYRAGSIHAHLSHSDEALLQGLLGAGFSSIVQTDNIIWHETAAELAKAVALTDGSIGLSTLGASGGARPVTIKGSCGISIHAGASTVKTQDYPLVQPLYMYLPNYRLAPGVRDWLDWLGSPRAQPIIRRAGFIDREAVEIPLAEQGDRLARAILAAGPEVPLEQLQQLVRTLVKYPRLSPTFRFSPGSTALDPQSRSNLIQLARQIAGGEYDGRALYLVGFGDGSGPALTNLNLARRRAENVYGSLVELFDGSLSDHTEIEVLAFGEALPVLCDEDEWGRRANRRVELWASPALQ